MLDQGRQVKKFLSWVIGIASIIAFSVACSAPEVFSQHGCADKLAQSFASNVKSTPGIWNCMSKATQNATAAAGMPTNDSVLGGNSPYDRYSYVGTGSGGRVVLYDLHVNFNDPTVKRLLQVGVNIPPDVTLTVWVNGEGKILDWAVAVPSL